MNNATMGQRTKLMAATLCGAGVLALGGLSLDRAEAQNSNEGPSHEPKAEQNDIAKIAPESETSELKAPKLDLGQVDLEVALVRPLDAGMALVSHEKKELLVSQRWLKLPSSDDMDQDEKDENALSTESEQQTEPRGTSIERAHFAPGEDLRLQASLEDVELLAFENEILTLRSEETVFQVPVDAIDRDLREEVSLELAEPGAESRSLTLQEIVRENRPLAYFEDLSTDLPEVGAVGVVLSTHGDRLILASVGPEDVELLEVPPALTVGQAVSWTSDDDARLDFDPLGAPPMMVEHGELELSGVIASVADETVRIEDGEMSLTLPRDLTYVAEGQERELEDLEVGSEVSVKIPEGRSEVLTQLGETLVLETEFGPVQVPHELMRTELGESALDLDRLSRKTVALEEMNAETRWEGVVLGREESVLIARVEAGGTTLVSIPLAEFSESLGEGQRVEVDPTTREVTLLDESSSNTTARESES